MRNRFIALVLVLQIVLFCSGCVFQSEEVSCSGKNITIYDDTNIIAPDGYFMEGYQWVYVDDHTKQLIITMVKENAEQ